MTRNSSCGVAWQASPSMLSLPDPPDTHNTETRGQDRTLSTTGLPLPTSSQTDLSCLGSSIQVRIFLKPYSKKTTQTTGITKLVLQIVAKLTHIILILNFMWFMKKVENWWYKVPLKLTLICLNLDFFRNLGVCCVRQLYEGTQGTMKERINDVSFLAYFDMFE